ncbi:hypothetical protein IHE44_0011581 [Lamprotornis superbus]|uniref:Uncharacterized protein n=1 Tax=Lamprotornis superbus TaxID=245042 RepID=A0A835NHL9_9PASS|nr:hypothetical protein IHE44_0011581 [Lamprotornis superbus]
MESLHMKGKKFCANPWNRKIKKMMKKMKHKIHRNKAHGSPIPGYLRHGNQRWPPAQLSPREQGPGLLHLLPSTSSIKLDNPGIPVAENILPPRVCSNGLGGNKSLHGLKASEAGRRNPHKANLPDSSNPVMCSLAHGGFNELG